MFAYLIERSRLLMVAATLASVIHGVCGVLMLTQINEALTTPAADYGSLGWRFAGCALAVMGSQIVSSILFERLNQQAHASLRTFVSGRVIAADYRCLECVGSGRVQSALSDHSSEVAEFFVSFPAILLNAITVLGCLVYMAWLSWQVFLVAAVVIGLGSLGYHLANMRATRHLERAAREQDRLFEHFRSLVDGSKELRLNVARRRRFRKEVLGQTIEKVRRERTVGMSVFLAAAGWGNFLIYAFIGLVLFVLVADRPDRAQIMTGFALVFLYMESPLQSLLEELPRMNMARVSGARIDEVASQLEQEESEAEEDCCACLRSVEMRSVCHQYFHEGRNDMFNLGPIDLKFLPGQVTYLVGGNGCGKTTLAKLLVGLYKPRCGAVLLNGQPIDDESRDLYRQTFSAIFSDFHLFSHMLHDGSPEVDARGNALLKKLQLHHKVQVRDGAFTTRALSQGQRKRLALVLAYLEDRPFLVFDEWAADQDPVFKDVFYRELLPELREQGRAVLVITHDDRYFHLADRLIRMESGQITAVEEPEREMSLRELTLKRAVS